jgi:hypothetical protein
LNGNNKTSNMHANSTKRLMVFGVLLFSIVSPCIKH